jgi:O-acetyl-ADP-ribose deacetylase (regulator of RNase III)
VTPKAKIREPKPVREMPGSGMERRFRNGRIELVRGDITTLNVDAIVNAANSTLAHGAGVAGAIVRKGGQSIQDESDAWVCSRGPVPPGSAAITSGGTLSARYVIHAVGPRMGEGEEDAKLRSAAQESLRLAKKHNLTSIAFPAISTGVFGFPIDRCARIMLTAAMEHLRSEPGLRRIVFCLFDEHARGIFQDTLIKLP